MREDQCDPLLWFRHSAQMSAPEMFRLRSRSEDFHRFQRGSNRKGVKSGRKEVQRASHAKGARVAGPVFDGKG